MASRRDKIARLLDSPIAGERAAAEAALGRLRVAKPIPGSPEWRAAMIEHQVMVQACAVRLGDPSLTPAEVNLLRRWMRYTGTPWEPGAEDLRRLHSRLVANEPADAEQVGALPAA